MMEASEDDLGIGVKANDDDDDLLPRGRAVGAAMLVKL